MDKHVANKNFKSDMEDFTYFVNDDVPDPSDYENNKDDFQGLQNRLDLYDVLDYTSSETVDDTYDKHIGAEVSISDTNRYAILVSLEKLRNNDGNPILTGTYDAWDNQYLYVVEPPDGTSECITTIIIVQNIFSKVDSEGYNYQILYEICDHSSGGTTIKFKDGFIQSDNGNLY